MSGFVSAFRCLVDVADEAGAAEDAAVVEAVSDHITVLHKPQCLSAAARARLFDLTLPYIARAFAQDVHTMDDSTRLDHLEHTLGGTDPVYFFGSLSGSELELYAHANFVVIPVSSQPGESTRLVLYLSAVVCDPLQQGRGMASALITAGLAHSCSLAQQNQYTYCAYFALRTMNVSVVKMMASACKGSEIYPVTACPTPEITTVATVLGEKLGWPTLVPESLVIPQAYPPFLIPVFKGRPKARGSKPSTMQTKVDSLLDRDAGDALVCVAKLEPNVTSAKL